MSVITVKTKNDYPDKSGFYWILEEGTEDFAIAEYCRRTGRFFTKTTNRGEVHYSYVFSVKAYKYIPKPHKIKTNQ
jgi:hypothetical protein